MALNDSVAKGVPRPLIEPLRTEVFKELQTRNVCSPNDSNLVEASSKVLCVTRVVFDTETIAVSVSSPVVKVYAKARLPLIS
jgi:hypothetical protein